MSAARRSLAADTRLIAAGIDGFDINFNAPGEAGLMVKQARQIGFDKTILQMGGPSVPEIIEVAGKLAEGFISYEMVDFDPPAVQPFVKTYAAEYGAGIMNSQTPAFYNATKILFEAIRRAGTVEDTTKVRDEVEKIAGYDAGIDGPVRWTGMANYGVNHQLALPLNVVEVKNGKPVHRATLRCRLIPALRYERPSGTRAASGELAPRDRRMISMLSNPIVLGQILINGLSLSSIYILVALGFTLLFGIMRVVNFAHGEFAMLGGFALYYLYAVFKLPWLLAIVLSRFWWRFRPCCSNGSSSAGSTRRCSRA